jgi:hypothetical protein
MITDVADCVLPSIACVEQTTAVLEGKGDHCESCYRVLVIDFLGESQLSANGPVSAAVFEDTWPSQIRVSTQKPVG